MTDALHAYLSYRDPVAALAWMTKLGFPTITRIDGPEGALQHAEVRVGEAIVMVGGFDDDYEAPRLRRRSVGYGLYVTTADVDARYETALDAGSRPVIVPEDTPWGGRRARVLDPGGYEWSFGDYRPGSSPDPGSSDAMPSR